MKLVFWFLFGGGVMILVAERMNWLSLDELMENLLPVGIGLLILLGLRLTASDSDPRPAATSLKETLMRNVIISLNRPHSVRLEIKKGFYSRSHGK